MNGVVQIDMTITMADGKERSVTYLGSKDDVNYSTMYNWGDGHDTTPLTDAIATAAAPHFAARTEVPVADLTQCPWVLGCDACKVMQREPEPGLMSWVAWVARHFRDAHAIDLVKA